MDPTQRPQAPSNSTDLASPQVSEPTPQSTYPSPKVVSVNPQQPGSGENPGQTLGIISIVLSFVGLSIVGIILGIISRKKSKAAGASTTLGTVGLVIGIVTTAFAALVFGVLILITMATYSSIQGAM